LEIFSFGEGDFLEMVDAPISHFKLQVPSRESSMTTKGPKLRWTPDQYTLLLNDIQSDFGA
jgi:hypothetical protein